MLVNTDKLGSCTAHCKYMICFKYTLVTQKRFCINFEAAIRSKINFTAQI